jgi:RNA polymerase sigma-70 factor (ECF subfamily)
MAEQAQDAVTLIQAARAGSREALGNVLETYRNYLLLIAERELGDDLRAKGGASDLVQEAFLEAHKDFAQFQGQTEADLRSWLRTLLLNRLSKFARRYRQTQKRGIGSEERLDANQDRGIGLAADQPTPSKMLMAGEHAQAVQLALERLPKDYRDVILLRYQEQLTFEEVGLRMQRSADAARKLWWRALVRLQEELESPA